MIKIAHSYVPLLYNSLQHDVQTLMLSGISSITCDMHIKCERNYRPHSPLSGILSIGWGGGIFMELGQYILKPFSFILRLRKIREIFA